MPGTRQSELTNSLVLLSTELKKKLTVPDAVTWLAGRQEPLLQSELMSLADGAWSTLEQNQVMGHTSTSFKSYCSRNNTPYWTLEECSDETGRGNDKFVVLSDNGKALLEEVRSQVDAAISTASVEEWCSAIDHVTQQLNMDDPSTSEVLNELSDIAVDNHGNGAEYEEEPSRMTGSVLARVAPESNSMTNIPVSLFHRLLNTRHDLHSEMCTIVSNHCHNEYLLFQHPCKSVRPILPYVKLIGCAIDHSSNHYQDIQTTEIEIRKGGSLMMSHEETFAKLGDHFECSAEDLRLQIQLYEEMGSIFGLQPNIKSYESYLLRITNGIKLLSDTMATPVDGQASIIHNLRQIQQTMRHISAVRNQLDVLMQSILTDQLMLCMKSECNGHSNVFERMKDMMEKRG